MTNIERHTATVKRLAKSVGFVHCGISKAERLTDHEAQLTDWLNNGYHGSMSWMENHFDKRLDPRLLVPGARSVVSLLFNYYPEENYDHTRLKISKYAYGADYHHVIKARMRELVSRINEEIGEVNGRVFVDSAPVLDRAWAARSGLGWIGKNSMLITKQEGSFSFIAELIIDIDLEPDSPTTDHCGTCTACIDACPTDAIVDNKVIDSNRCISYLTIELSSQIPSSYRNDMEGWVFGCDICQDVCPWNRFAKPHAVEELKPKPELGDLHHDEWKELTEEVFSEVFRKSAVKRAGYVKLKENIQICNYE